MDPIELVHQDDDLVVANKPAGLLSVPTPGARGRALAQVLARRAVGAGMALHLAEQRDGGAKALRDRLKGQLDQEQSRGLIGTGECAALMAQVSGGPAQEGQAQAEFIIEASGSRMAAMPALVARCRSRAAMECRCC